MKIHIEGMGISGCLLAVLLDRQGHTISWHDTDIQRVAWPACTGAIYPAGSLKFGPDWDCYEVWARWFKEGIFYPFIERANYWFAHQKPPHQGRYQFEGPTKHGLRMAVPPSFHLNAQKLVPWVRYHFSANQKPKPKDVDLYVISHGFGKRLSHVYWGWTRIVSLDYDTSVYGCREFRPAFYFRPNKFVMAYAYPVPHSWDEWYAGSSIYKQPANKRRCLEIEPKFERWLEQFLKLSGGAVRVYKAGAMFEGWRPAAADNDWVRSEGRKVVSLRPLWNSGIRHFPEQWRQLGARLK